MEHLTPEEAFEAMFLYLQDYYGRVPSEDLGDILSGLDRRTWADGQPADPAAWYDWVKAVERVLSERVA